MTDLMSLCVAIAVLASVFGVMAAVADHGPTLAARMRGWRR